MAQRLDVVAGRPDAVAVLAERLGHRAAIWARAVRRQRIRELRNLGDFLEIMEFAAQQVFTFNLLYNRTKSDTDLPVEDSFASSLSRTNESFIRQSNRRLDTMYASHLTSLSSIKPRR